MAIAKVILNGETLMDVTSNTVDEDNLKSGYTAIKNDGTPVTGSYAVRLQSKSATPTKSSQTIVPDVNYDAMSQVIIGAIPSAYLIPSGTYSISSNGTYDIGSYQSVDVSVAGGESIFSYYKSFIENGSTAGQAQAFPYTLTHPLSSLNKAISCIGSNTFTTKKMSLVEFGSSTIEIGAYAFCSCSSLLRASFRTVTAIGTRAFCSCTKLSVFSAVLSFKTLPEEAFRSCMSLTSIDFGTTLEVIASSACMDCALGGDFINSTIIRIEYGGFFQNSFTGISLNNLKAIGSCAFQRNMQLLTVNCPNLKSISASAFFGCILLSSVIINSEYSYVMFGTFESCSNLASLDLPNVTSIGNYAFRNCRSLSNISIPKVTSIGSYVFAYCYVLSQISLPNINYIGSSTFIGAGIRSLYLNDVSSVPTLASTNAFSGTRMSYAADGDYGSIYVPASLYDAFISASNWSVYSSRIVAI